MKMPESDNHHLSEAGRGGSQEETKIAVDCKLTALRLDPIHADAIQRFVEAATAPNTRRAYRSDLKHYLKMGGHLPSSVEEVAGYLARYAGVLSCSTLERRLVAVGSAHKELGLGNPCGSLLVRRTIRGIKRTYGARQRRAAAISIDQLSAISAILGTSLRDRRDRALLLLGFHGGFRRSELCAVDCKSLTISREGVVIFIARSKTDQERAGREIEIRRISGPCCAVRALEKWFAASGLTEGPVFRAISRSGQLSVDRLSGEAVSAIVKRWVSCIGSDGLSYSAHSLRAGYVTHAVNSNVPTWRIRQQTGHANDAMLERYIRQRRPFASEW